MTKVTLLHPIMHSKVRFTLAVSVEEARNAIRLCLNENKNLDCCNNGWTRIIPIDILKQHIIICEEK